MNLREQAKRITLQQRAKRPEENLSIARVDQVLKLHRKDLAMCSNEEVIRMLDRERKEMGGAKGKAAAAELAKGWRGARTTTERSVRLTVKKARKAGAQR